MFNSNRTVRVTNKEELERALKSADRIEVDGDPELLRYAEQLTSGQPDMSLEHVPPETREVEFTRREWSATPASGLVAPANDLGVVPPAPSPVAFAPPPAAAPRRATGRWVLWTSLPVLVLALAAALFFYSSARGPDRVVVPPAPALTDRAPGIDRWQAPVPKHETIPREENLATGSAGVSDLGPTIVKLGWIVVALAAIAALYKLARFAVADGRNVEVSWKVTEKVSGKLVIAKVPTRGARAPRVRAA